MYSLRAAACTSQSLLSSKPATIAVGCLSWRLLVLWSAATSKRCSRRFTSSHLRHLCHVRHHTPPSSLTGPCPLLLLALASGASRTTWSARPTSTACLRWRTPTSTGASASYTSQCRGEQQRRWWSRLWWMHADVFLQDASLLHACMHVAVHCWPSADAEYQPVPCLAMCCTDAMSNLPDLPCQQQHDDWPQHAHPSPPPTCVAASSG
jgi:hypothetical protein